MVISCPNPACRKRLKAADTLAGKQVSCPACKTVFIAPPLARVDEPAARQGVQGTAPAPGPVQQAPAKPVPQSPAAGSPKRVPAAGGPPPRPARAGATEPSPGQPRPGRPAAVAMPPAPRTPPIPQGDGSSTGGGSLTTSPVERLIAYAKTWSPATFGLILLCFLLPFVHVSCGNERVITFSGIQLVTGTKVTEADINPSLRTTLGADIELPPELRNPSDQRVDPELWAAVAFLAAIAGLAISFLKDKRGWIGGTIAGATGIAALLLLKMKMDSDASREGEGLLELHYAMGYCLALAVFAGTTALHGHCLLAAKKRPIAEVGPSAAVPAVWTAAAKKRARRIAIAIAVVACLVAGGVAAYLVVMGPAPVRQGRKLIASGYYKEAVAALTPHLTRRPLDSKARYLLAIAQINEYATADTGGGWTTISMEMGTALEGARQNLTKVLAAKPGWRATARDDLATAAARVPAGTVNAIDRTLTIARLRAGLNLAGKPELAAELMDQLAPSAQEGSRGILRSEAAVLQILEWDPSLSGRIVELVVGGATGSEQELRMILPTLERWANQRPVLAPLVASELLNKAKSLYEAGRSAEAKAVLSKALELDPKVAETQEHALLAIRLMDPDDAKLTRCQYFLKQWPQSPSLAEVLMAMVKDAVAVFDRYGQWRRAQAGSYLDAGQDVANRLIREFPAMDRLDVEAHELAQRLAANNQFDNAITLMSDLVAAVPDSPIRLQIANSIAQWRQQAGKGTLAPEFDMLAQEAAREFETKTMTLTAGGAVPALVSAGNAVRIVQVADGCTIDKFNSQEKEMLRQWVAGGGVLLTNNNVLSLFEIQYGNWHVSGECRPAVVAQICPVLTGCASVVISRSDTSALDLTYPRAIPLLVTGKESNQTCCWSLVPYGKGWISDAKKVDTSKGDGARFWLNFRLFCLGKPIPGAPPLSAPAPVPGATLSGPSQPQPSIPPVVPPTPLSPSRSGPTRITDAGELTKALANAAARDVLWVALTKAAAGIGNIKKLQEWVQAGGVLWVETDVAEAFGFGSVTGIPPQISQSNAMVPRIQHALVEGLAGTGIGCDVAADGGVIAGSKEKILSAMMPLLVQSMQVRQGRRTAVTYCVFCGVRRYGDGFVVFRPMKIGTAGSGGQRLEEKLTPSSLNAEGQSIRGP